MSFKEWRQKRFLRKAFGKYIGKDAIDEILRKDNSLTQLEERNVLYFLIHISQDGTYPEKVRLLIERLPLELVVIEEITQAYIKVSAGILKFPDTPDLQVIKSSMIEALHKSDAWFSAVCGTSQALVGNVGSERRLSFGSVLPDFRTKLTRLLELKDREIAEI